MYVQLRDQLLCASLIPELKAPKSLEQAYQARVAAEEHPSLWQMGTDGGHTPMWAWPLSIQRKASSPTTERVCDDPNAQVEEQLRMKLPLLQKWR